MDGVLGWWRGVWGSSGMATRPSDTARLVARTRTSYAAQHRLIATQQAPLDISALARWVELQLPVAMFLCVVYFYHHCTGAHDGL